MIFHKTSLEDAYIVELDQHKDNRGSYSRAFCSDEFTKHGLNPSISQANIVFTAKAGTLRGMHYQVTPYEEAKFIRCFSGSIYDVIIDLRPSSSTFNMWEGFELNQTNFKALFVPAGFAHGFQTLSDNTVVYYHASSSYHPGSERGLRWNDPAFNIKWPVSEPILSEKDKNHKDYKKTNHANKR